MQPADQLSCILGTDWHVLRKLQQVLLQLSLLTPYHDSLVGKNCQRPEEQDHTGFLLKVLDYDVEVLFLNGIGMFRHADVLRRQERVGLGANQCNVSTMHDNEDHQQAEDLVNHFDREVLTAHRLSTSFRCRLGRAPCCRH